MFPLAGLTDSQVIENQKKYGLNELVKKRKTPLIIKLLKKLANPLILILLFASILSAFLGQRSDFYIILTILLISVVLDVYQEHQAQDAADKLAQKLIPKALVIRNNKKIEINSNQVTIGDLVFLRFGNIIPADCRIVESKNLLVDQSVLTGESFPVEKNIEDLIFMGTHVASGFATAKVVEIGNKTEIGKIARSITVMKPQTEFEIGLNKFSLLLAQLTFILSVVLITVNLLLGHTFISTLMFVLALAIGFAPELLPMILTINLSKGALRLSKKGVIVKYLPSIENFGSMDVLCTDKTGTLTVGDTVLKSFFNVDGDKDDAIITNAYLNSYFQSGFRNPIDEAILKQKNINIKKYIKIDELTYDFFRKRSSVVVKSGSNLILISKGAVQSILPLCLNKNKIKVDVEKLNNQGLRVIALATKKIDVKKNYSFADENNLTCLGFLVFYDAPKISANKTVLELQNHGVNLKILSGDNNLVTISICKQVGIPINGVISGDQIRRLSDEELKDKVDVTTVFAELDPDSKLRIILALKQNKHVVGFLGDGINDAPSLKNADVGISVDNAVDVAKESADLILSHKDLSVLLIGIKEGRSTFANIMKYISMGTSSTFGNMVSLSVASILLPFLPMLPAQVLLNDLLYDISQVLLVKDHVDQKLVQHPYRWDLKHIKNFTIVFGGISSVFDLITFYLLYFILKVSIPAFQTGWFLESIISQMFIIFSIRTFIVPFYKSKISLIFASGILAIVIFVLWLPFSFLASYLHLVLLPPKYFIFLTLIILSYFSLIELAKSYFYRHTHSFNQ
ncbi:MAG: magnesium-translocating P-type ATPase [Candidatus Shapirobacteria bacterium]|nr:magnesium-translocating P-type ATPase [Candidatus Shapirobacteria bacterium]